MSLEIPVIHLHGGPSDCLRLAWNDTVPDKVMLLREPLAGWAEYDYVYLPRLPAPAIVVAHSLKPPTRVKTCWRRWGVAFRSWLLTPSSYPLDLQRYRDNATPGRTSQE